MTVDERPKIMAVYWNARCTCGWETLAPNDADTVGNKIKTHLQQNHRTAPASIHVTSFVEARPIGQLPLSPEGEIVAASGPAVDATPT